MKYWKFAIIPSMLILYLGLFGLFYPYPYISFYLRRAGTNINSLNVGIATILEIMFRANGLGMTMAGILAVFITLFSLRRGEKWAVSALIFAGTIGFIGEVILEIIILKVKI